MGHSEKGMGRTEEIRRHKMHELADQFAKYCEANVDLTTQSEYGYQSLSLCILD